MLQQRAVIIIHAIWTRDMHNQRNNPQQIDAPSAEKKKKQNQTKKKFEKSFKKQ